MAILAGMSPAEINSAIDRLSPEERLAVSMHLRRRFCEDSPERSEEISAIMDEMEAGNQFTLVQLRELDAEVGFE